MYDYGARFYDPALARFHTVDPLTEKNHSQSGYVYAANNPIKYIDFMGLDSLQRAQAVQMAREYVNQSTGTKSSYESGSKKGPGNPVDCSGLASNCVVAGEEPNPNKGESNGVSNIANNTTKVDMNDIQEGNLVTFNNNKHIGVISGNIIKDKNGKVLSFSVVGSQSSTGPSEFNVQTDKSSSWSNGNNGYWSPKLGSAYTDL